jgi:hypothetical protein
MYAIILAALLAQMQSAAPAPDTNAAPIIVPAASAAPMPASTAPEGISFPERGITRRMPANVPNIAPTDAVIRNSGSTNTLGYTIVIHADYTADVYSNGETQHKAVGAAQAKWLFDKLNAAEPLNVVGAGRCMKSASFGTYTTIRYGGQMTPDLSCGGGPEARELMRTVGVIVNQLGVSPLMGARRRLL